jgi:hypothetical protein
MAFQRLHEAASTKTSEKNVQFPDDARNIIMNGMVSHEINGDRCTISYVSKMEPAELLASGIPLGFALKISGQANIEELQLLFKKSVEEFEGTIDDASLERHRMMIEHIYNDLHQASKIKVEEIQVLKREPARTAANDKVLPVKCPTCKVATKLAITWDLLVARQNNKNPIWNLLLKGDKTECGHSFIVFVDKLFCIRGCEALD